MTSVDDQLATLLSGVQYGDESPEGEPGPLGREMRAELRALLQQGRPLRVYLGIDPTATSLTLGHTVPLRKLRQFQQLGHQAIFLIGDYTALIGDPSDKNKLRPQLTPEDIAANEATYFDQAARLLDAEKTELRHNSEWLSKLDFPQVISLMSKFTVAEMLRRDNFRQRFDAGEAVYLHEFLYALMQGYDALALECDVQVGGTEQLFNLMAGRKIQEDAGQRPHVPITLPILVGLDGKARMSKSAGNHIGVNDPPDEQYGKAMSLPDDVIMDFYTLATNVPRAEFPARAEEVQSNPMAAKKRLARTIVSEFWGDDAARAAEERFRKLVQEKPATREDVPEDAVRKLDYVNGQTYAELLVRAGAADSKRSAARLLREGAVERLITTTSVSTADPSSLSRTIQDNKLRDPAALVEEGEFVRVGKRIYISVGYADE